ncbi:archaetidylinositol phosphate synthase [Desulfurococcus mucosus]|uniref:Archaetidylinositol phosphate synthase n=1 Tax=Desulfurococcus mucosus (strain ATCC 35584 / DSM 2162 / JCM 9187 / O7/1) TaxID=765177 RepID=E8R703_DESM0|nr:archaetidylinositol phosphate synthase [Desulfurococcus mucosus]ADV64436.1 CDP-alcohol phosphatidyltransferase [Desulfurococcus mucosus DSM 2162]
MLNKLRGRIVLVMERLAKPLVLLGVSPHALTVSSMLVLLVGVFVFAYTSNTLLYLIFIAASSMLDALDGTVARVTGRTSRFGAFLDSTVDRVNDAAMIWSLSILGFNQTYIVLLLVSSMLVSYVRARGESLGAQLMGIGLIERPERILGIVLILLLYNASIHLAEILLLILAILSAATVLQRILQVYRFLGTGD